MMQLNDLYRALLKTAGMSVTKDGFVRLEEKGEVIPATKGGRQVVIPLPEQLMSPLINDRLLMHLLSENVLEPESEELAFYRSLLIHRFNKVVSTLIGDLLELGASEAKHKNLNSDQADYLRLVAGVDDVSVKNWTSLVKAMPVRQVQRAITHVYLKKAGMVGGKSFKRVATVKFPLYEELALWAKEDQTRQAEKEAGHKAVKKKDGAKVERQIYEVTIRKMDREPFMNLLQYLIPQIAEADAYNYGSNSMMAPGVDALMHSFTALAGRVNDVIDLFSDAIDGIKDLRFNSEWVAAFENIDLMWTQVRDIPRLSSPEAVLPPTAAAPTQVQQPVQAAPVPAQPQQTAPWAQPPAQPTAPGPGQYVNGQWVPHASVGAWHPNQQPQQPQHQAQPEQKSSSAGVSAAELFRANPVVAGAAMMSPNVQTGMYPPQMYPGMYPQQMPPGMYPGQVMYPQQMPPGMYPQLAPQPLNTQGVPQGNLPWQQRRGY